jgi:iron complex transport system substrate-binding protein
MKLFATFAALLLAVAPAAARTVTDELGRVVNVPDHPHRLICLAPSVADDVYAIGAGADVIAVSDYTKYPPEARKKPSVGLPLNPAMETIVSLHPDLILGSGDSKYSETLSRLDRLHIPVFMVSTHGIDGIYKSILSLGMVLGREQAAQQVVANLRSREAAIRARVAGKPVVNLFMPIWYDPIMTIGKSAYITEMIAIAGGHSVTDDIPQEWPQVSLEAIVARAPEALLLEKGSGMSLEAVRNRPGWQYLPAIRNHRIYYVDGEIEYPSPVAFDALEGLAKQLHP